MQMKILRIFSAQISETVARERVAAFYRKSGFRQRSDSDGVVHYQRGSISGTLFSFNPTRWPCTMNVFIMSEAGSSKVRVEAEISTDPTERSFGAELLTAELGLLEFAVTANEIKTYNVSDLKKRVAAYVFYIVRVFVSFLFSVILGIFAGLFAYIKLNLSILSASAIGAGGLLVFGGLLMVFWGRRKKN
jgi:uncharacterized membrane protein YagU involved in acid resistance